MPSTPAHSSTSMESAYSPNSTSSSPSRSAYDSPSRQLYSETRRRRGQRWRRSDHDVVEDIDSPSRQLVLEFNQMIINAEHSLNLRLDLAAADHVKSHQEDLAAAASEHARILKFAEGELKLELIELQREQIKQEIEQARREADKREQLLRLERQKAAEAEQERQRLAAIQREEALAEEKRKKEAEEAEARRKAEIEAEEKKKAALAEADKAKAVAEAAAAEKARQEAAQQAQKAQQSSLPSQVYPPIQTASAGPPSLGSQSTLSAALIERKAASLPAREADHKSHLVIHQKLKEFRKWIESASKGHPTLSKGLGEMRRELRVKAGQISFNKANNMTALKAVRDILRKALAIPNTPTVDIRPFIFQSMPSVQDSDAQYPAVLLYYLNIFAKCVMAQFISEASNEVNPIDAVGLMAVSIFSDDEFKWNNISMIDLLLSKMHAACPVLYGIYGRENTQQGRIRLGWQREDGNFVDTQVHEGRMLGLGAGFASMTLRVFKSKVPPIPGSEYWRAMSCIINTPPEELTASHYIVLKGMLKNFVEKFIAQFGQPALGALKLAVVDLPKRVSDQTANLASVKNAASQVEVLGEKWKKDLHLTLA